MSEGEAHTATHAAANMLDDFPWSLFHLQDTVTPTPAQNSTAQHNHTLVITL